MGWATSSGNVALTADFLVAELQLFVRPDGRQVEL